jgi:hypothetical protein
MPAPFVFITTHKVKPGQYDRFIALSRDFEEFLRVNEPDLLGSYAYLDADNSEVSLVQIHRDAKSAEHHMNVAAQKIGRGIALTERCGSRSTAIRDRLWDRHGRPTRPPVSRSASSPKCWGLHTGLRSPAPAGHPVVGTNIV